MNMGTPISPPITLEGNVVDLRNRIEALERRLGTPTVEELQARLDATNRELWKLNRTVYGIQQMLGKAAAYVGREQGGLPRDPGIPEG